MLPSKMRFLAAQMSALLADDLWLANAAHANAMAAVSSTRSAATSGSPTPPRSTACIPCSTRRPRATLAAWSFFYDWDVHTHTVRWMTAWDTTDDDIATFAAAVREVTAVTV